jgi:hypothetical protein
LNELERCISFNISTQREKRFLIADRHEHGTSSATFLFQRFILAQSIDFTSSLKNRENIFKLLPPWKYTDQPGSRKEHSAPQHVRVCVLHCNQNW